ncbi:MAG: NADH:flavin oxidoreductase [Proteobacteria bacterium]|nr:NADH:flavin oxidoreductase [Pseudomonadota bacterium]
MQNRHNTLYAEEVVASALTEHPALVPLQLNEIELKNRVVVAPMTRVSATAEGVPSAAMARYYSSFARGGFGLIITEGTYPERRHGRGYQCQPGLVDAAQAGGWRRVVDAVHSEGGAIVLQIMHAGALSQSEKDTIAPSAIRPRGEKMAEYGGSGQFPLPRAMTAKDIARVIADFAATAALAASVDFDGVEIHGANGYLIDQFLTAESNVREDSYGGDMAQRAEIVVAIAQAVRRAVPGGFAIGLRISQGKVNDPDYRWPGGRRDAEALFEALRRADLDYLHMASEGRGWRSSAGLADGETLTRLARRMVEVPVVANGGLHDPALAAEVLRDGHADLLALGRGALVNRDWPQRVAAGHRIAPVTDQLFAAGVTLAGE